jgi:hypothetical protein
LTRPKAPSTSRSVTPNESNGISCAIAQESLEDGFKIDP